MSTTPATRAADSTHRRPSSPAFTVAVTSFRPQPLPSRPAPGRRYRRDLPQGATAAGLRRRRDLRDATLMPGVALPQANIPNAQPMTGAMVARLRHPPSRSAPPERWSEENFLQGSGEHLHPDPICSSAPSPPKQP